MKPTTAAILSLCLSLVNPANADTFGVGDLAFDIEFVAIGDPGNPADSTGEPRPTGQVDYVYRIGKFEISREMAERASQLGDLETKLFDMSTRGGNHPNNPATGLNRRQSARFVNWLNTSSGFQPAYKFLTQPGDENYNSFRDDFENWAPGDFGFDDANPIRNRHARYFLPSTDEWYKAAFYDPNKDDGLGGYWRYAIGSDVKPVAVAEGTDPGTAVYGFSFFDHPHQGPAEIDMAGGLSPYGTMGMGGNAIEYEETLVSGFSPPSNPTATYIRGGEWGSTEHRLRSTGRQLFAIDSGNPGVGFRVVSVPEPHANFILVLGLMIGLRTYRRRLSQRSAYTSFEPA